MNNTLKTQVGFSSSVLSLACSFHAPRLKMERASISFWISSSFSRCLRLGEGLGSGLSQKPCEVPRRDFGKSNFRATSQVSDGKWFGVLVQVDSGGLADLKRESLSLPFVGRGRSLISCSICLPRRRDRTLQLHVPAP